MRRLKYTFRRPDTPGNPLANMVNVVSPKLQALCMCIVNMKPAYEIASIVQHLDADELEEFSSVLETLINACALLPEHKYDAVVSLINKLIPYVHALRTTKPKSLDIVYAYDNLVSYM